MTKCDLAPARQAYEAPTMQLIELLPCDIISASTGREHDILEFDKF